MGTPSAWTEEARQFVRDNWQTKSASHIANALGEKGFRFSRSAVIGLGHRMKLVKPLHLQPRVPRPPRAPKPSRISLITAPTQRRPDNEKAPVVPFTPRVVDTSPLHLTVLQLDATTCKYEVSGADDPALYTFCGRTAFTEQPYCADHCRLCYVSPGERRRAKAMVPA